MAERYLFQNGFVKYLMNNSGSSYVKKDGGIQTLKNMTKKNKNKFNAQFSPVSHLSRATIQKEEGYDHFLDLNKTSYDCPYNPSFYKVTSFYFVYKIRGYDHTEPENNYLVRLRWATTTMVCVSFEMKPQCGLGEYRQRNMPVGKTFRISPPVTTIHVERIYGTSYVSPLM